MENKRSCNRSSNEHFRSAEIKYRRRVGLCLFATIVIASMTVIIIPEFRIYWTIGWTPVLCYFNWRYWIRLRKDGFFECDHCRKAKHTRHIREFIDQQSGVRYVLCDVCLVGVRSISRRMRAIRLIMFRGSLSERWTGLVHAPRDETRFQRKPGDVFEKIKLGGKSEDISLGDPKFPVKRPTQIEVAT